MLESLAAVAWAFSTVGAVAQSEPGKKFIEATIGQKGLQMEITNVLTKGIEKTDKNIS